MEKIVTLYGQSNWDFIYKSYVDYVDDWFLASSPTSPIMIVGAYLLFILKIGPAFMKNRPAYNLRTVLRFYNFAQTLLSCYMVYYGTSFLVQSGFLESQCLLQDKEYTYTLMAGAYLYTTAKLTELLDTIFFVLRKKWSQISFLHVYHHTFMYCVCWYTMKYAPSYMFAFMATLNSFVHVIMYAYYGLSTFPELTKYLWWKKYITKLQLVQFFMMIVSLTFNYVTSKCPQSLFLLVLSWAHCILFIYLFAKFYIDNYKKNKQYIKDTAKPGAKIQKDFLMSSNHKIEEKSI